jgi:hypothetical protein
MTLKLAKTSIGPLLEQRAIRMLTDACLLERLTTAEIRSIYTELETARDALSRMLDRVDGKHV